MIQMIVGVISIAGKQKYNEMRPKDPARALLYDIKPIWRLYRSHRREHRRS